METKLKILLRYIQGLRNAPEKSVNAFDLKRFKLKI